MSNLQVNTNMNKSSKTQERIQIFGRFLSGMVLPNIGAFIAWGLITTLFIPTGWLPNANLAKLVGPMITYLLPLLIGYTGGKTVAGTRGGVLGAIATMGVIIGADIPMFLGAMIVGPLAGWVIKKFDKAVDGKIPAGFEMLVNNFSAGILGGALSILAFLGIGPVVEALSNVIKGGVQGIVDAGLLPLVSIFIEPGKILFLNNAINHGILSPLGIQQAKEAGKSIFFLLETNPGPGLGILLAYWVFSKGLIKQSAPGAIIIHFFGGIHEIYFPYVLMKPILLLAVIGGGASGVFTNKLLGSGLVAPPSPGSIFSLMAMSPRGGLLVVLAGVLVATVVSFVIASFFIKRSSDTLDDSELDDAKVKSKDLKNVYKNANANANVNTNVYASKNISKVIFACDAGMGSSAMGATTLRNKFKKAGLNIEVVNCAINELPSDAQMVVTHESLADRARSKAPNAELVTIKNFIDSPEYEKLVNRLK